MLSSLFLVQAWVPSDHMPIAVNVPSWSLSCEIAFYVALPFVAPRILRTSHRAAVQLGVFCAGWIAAAGFLALVLPLGYWPLARAPEFVAGVLLAAWMQRGWRAGPRTRLLGLIATPRSSHCPPAVYGSTNRWRPWSPSWVHRADRNRGRPRPGRRRYPTCKTTADAARRLVLLALSHALGCRNTDLPVFPGSDLGSHWGSSRASPWRRCCTCAWKGPLVRCCVDRRESLTRSYQ